MSTVIVLLFALGLPLACKDSETVDDTSSDGGADGGGDGGTADGGGETATISISGNVTALDGTSAEGAQVCYVVDGVDAACDTVGAAGRFTLEAVPASTVGAVRFAGGPLATFYFNFHTATSDVEAFNVGIDTPAIVQSYYDQAGVTRDAAGVVVLTELYPVVYEGFVASLDPASGVGPYYYGAWDGTLDLSLEATGKEVGMAVFLNVDRQGGPYTTSFTDGSTVCTESSWGDPQVPAWTVPADADVAYAMISCGEL